MKGTCNKIWSDFWFIQVMHHQLTCCPSSMVSYNTKKKIQYVVLNTKYLQNLLFLTANTGSGMSVSHWAAL